MASKQIYVFFCGYYEKVVVKCQSKTMRLNRNSFRGVSGIVLMVLRCNVLILLTRVFWRHSNKTNWPLSSKEKSNNPPQQGLWMLRSQIHVSGKTLTKRYYKIKPNYMDPITNSTDYFLNQPFGERQTPFYRTIMYVFILTLNEMTACVVKCDEPASSVTDHPTLQLFEVFQPLSSLMEFYCTQALPQSHCSHHPQPQKSSDAPAVSQHLPIPFPAPSQHLPIPFPSPSHHLPITFPSPNCRQTQYLSGEETSGELSTQRFHSNPTQRVNIGLVFERWPERWLRMNANTGAYLLDL